MQRLVGQIAQTPLLDSLGRRVNRRQRLIDRGVLVLSQQAVLRMNHLQARRAFAGFTEACHVNTGLELRLLCARKMKKAQRYLARAIANSYEKVTPAAIRDLRQQYLSRDETADAGFKGAELNELRAILVAQR